MFDLVIRRVEYIPQLDRTNQLLEAIMDTAQELLARLQAYESRFTNIEQAVSNEGVQIRDEIQRLTDLITEHVKDQQALDDMSAILTSLEGRADNMEQTIKGFIPDEPPAAG
jgi:hypothetical protein